MSTAFFFLGKQETKINNQLAYEQGRDMETPLQKRRDELRKVREWTLQQGAHYYCINQCRKNVRCVLLQVHSKHPSSSAFIVTKDNGKPLQKWRNEVVTLEQFLPTVPAPKALGICVSTLSQEVQSHKLDQTSFAGLNR